MPFVPPPCELPGSAVLALPPEIDLCNAEELLRRVLRATRSDALRHLVLDLTGTVFMDSQGVRLIGLVRQELGGRVRLRIAAAPETVPHLLLELTGLRRDIPVYDNLAEALRP
ncbi:STAS domain-containing protein [Streptomyces ziwulingensis]|uniref:STAS domain-containing protein n=1 Tax=Streptomyces ziwulingensis TaxID=1045501 RepID=A0ABP9D0F0_9ACTN